VVEADEREQGLRAILNFGHTFAHAVETLTEYRRYRHGEVVAMGMAAACRLGGRVAGFNGQSAERLESLLAALGLPTRLPRRAAEDYLRVMYSDKKVRSGRLRFVVPTRIGRVEVRGDVAEEDVIRTLEESFGARENG
jgi:3-dehydroquinate synthase